MARLARAIQSQKHRRLGLWMAHVKWAMTMKLEASAPYRGANSIAASIAASRLRSSAIPLPAMSKAVP